MPPNNALTEEKIIRRIESRLGGGGVAIEIDPDSWKATIEDALEYFNLKRPARRFAKLDATTTQKRYLLYDGSSGTPVMTGIDAPRVAGVLHVHFITRRTQPSQVDPFDPFDTALAGITLGSGSGETFGEILQRLAYSEDASRIVDSEPDYEAVWDGELLYLYLDIPRAHIQVTVEYSAYWTTDPADTRTGMHLMPEGDVAWMLDYIEALASIRLGRARNKFGGIIGPDGNASPVDGEGLVNQGIADKKELEEKLERRRRPLPPVLE